MACIHAQQLAPVPVIGVDSCRREWGPEEEALTLLTRQVSEDEYEEGRAGWNGDG